MIATAYLVVRRPRPRERGTAKVVRVTQTRPWLDADEAMIRIALELPDDLFEAPILVVPVSKQEIAVAVELAGDVE